MEIQKQLEYWVNTAEEDYKAAELLISNNKILYGLFFCHLCLEKGIKAHVVRYTGNTPPKIHNLAYLVNLTDLLMTEDDKDLCAIMMTYQIEGRYPEYFPNTPSIEKTTEYLHKTKQLLQWLKMKL